MGTLERLNDAKFLFDAERYEGALLSVLVAAAATSRKRFPQGTPSRKNPVKTMGDGEAFETFFAEEMSRVGKCSVLFDGKCNPSEFIFYKWMRCSLAHEAELPPHIDFYQEANLNVVKIGAEPGPPERLRISYSVVLLIGWLVATSRENSDLPPSIAQFFLPRATQA